MNTTLPLGAVNGASRSLPPVWHQRAIRRSDLAAVAIVAAPIVLSAHILSGAVVVEYALYGALALALLPQVGTFVANLRGNSANLFLVLLFSVLGIATVAAYVQAPSAAVLMQIKGLAAAAAWASIYIVVFSAVANYPAVDRVTRGIDTACLLISASVYASALAHLAGVRVGEVLEFGDGAFRAFGPLGDQVGFVLVLPVVICVAASRPVMVGFHLGALLFTATRGAMVCLIVSLAAYFLMRASSRIGRRQGVAGLAACLVVGALVWATPLSDVLMRRAAEAPDQNAYSLRLVAMEEGIKVAAANPWLGLGFNGFGATRRAMAEDWLVPNIAANGLSRTSNQYIQTATDGGVAALLCLLLFAAYSARNAMRVASWREASPSLVGSQAWLIGVLVGNQTALWMLGGTATGFFVFAVAGLAAGTSRLAARAARTPR